jgi:hypothetical protein
MQRWGKHVSRCQATAINFWMTQERGGDMWPRQQWRNNRSTVGRSVSRVWSRVYRRDWSSFRARWVLGGGQPREVSPRLRVRGISELKWSIVVEEESSSTCEDFKCDVETLCMLSCRGIGSVWFRETFIIPLLRSAARRRLVETENPSACATVKCELCKSLYGPYLSVIKSV